MEKKSLRILDANYNRAKEGLRVCEDIARFLLDDARLTKRLKALRHKMTGVINKSPVKYESAVMQRRAGKDVGKKLDYKGRKTLQAILASNIQRAKESLRVLEEVYKGIDAKTSAEFKNARFSVYSIEKEIVRKIRDYDATGKS